MLAKQAEQKKRCPCSIPKTEAADKTGFIPSLSAALPWVWILILPLLPCS